ncbi:unnamed protein product [Prorocentrum cordatum]|uniref:Uncharacterized protein n=1 Tax=Prorocentrum cordatum TaxID=2364126 RepID=A0ABN9V727_9DINO|nr:unnamed protein product [Polarella glacialis]
MGKKPDALLNMVVFRISEAAATNREWLMKAIEQGPHSQAAAEAVGVLERWGQLVQNPDAILKATRCFKIRLNTEGEDQVRWIFACNHHPDLKTALKVLRLNGGMESVAILLGHDRGPRSKVAKQIEHLAFRDDGKTKSAGKKESRK